MPTSKRSSYHHGDLRNALIEAGVHAARAGGPEAIVLQRIASEVGVSAAAAYRHFPNGHDELVHAVGHRGWSQMASSMHAAIDACPKSRDATKRAMAHFRAVGRAYVEFAIDDHGLFLTSCMSPVSEDDHDILKLGGGAFAILHACLNELETTGLLIQRDRENADVAAWSAVHGLAVLLTTGPLSHLGADEREATIERVLDMVGSGLFPT